MSTRSTVDADVVRSVRKTSKSSGRRRTACPLASSRRRVLLAHQGVRHRRPEVEVERVPELERLGRLLAVAATAGALEAMAAERVAPQPGEQVVEHLLADPAAAAGRELQPVAVPVEVARRLQAGRQVLQRVEVAGRVRPEQVTDVRPVDVAEIAGAADPLEVALQLVQRLEPAELVQRRLEAHRLVAAEPHPVPQPVGEQLVEVRRELGEVPLQAVVLQQRVDGVLELRALLGRERSEERLHRRHALGQLLDHVVERRRAREEGAVLGQEVVDLAPGRLVAREALREQPVEVLDHRSLGREVLGLHALDGIRQPLAHAVEHRAPEPVDQGLEALASRWVHEVVVLEAADPGADVGRQRVQRVEPLRRDAAQHPLEVGVGRAAPRPSAAASASVSSRCWTPARSASTISSSSRRTSASGSASEPWRRISSPAFAQPVEQVAQAVEVAARRVARPRALAPSAGAGPRPRRRARARRPPSHRRSRRPSGRGRPGCRPSGGTSRPAAGARREPGPRRPRARGGGDPGSGRPSGRRAHRQRR